MAGACWDASMYLIVPLHAFSWVVGHATGPGNNTRRLPQSIFYSIFIAVIEHLICHEIPILRWSLVASCVYLMVVFSHDDDVVLMTCLTQRLMHALCLAQKSWTLWFQNHICDVSWSTDWYAFYVLCFFSSFPLVAWFIALDLMPHEQTLMNANKCLSPVHINAPTAPAASSVSVPLDNIY